MSKFDYCEPMLLKTQHRSHSAIAEIYGSFAYDGSIQTGSRIINAAWSAEHMEEKILASRFPAKAVTLLRYNGESYRDHAVSNETEGGIANAFEQNVIEAVCKEWCSKCNAIEKHILVLSPYKAQVREIQRKLRAANLNNIEVATVDSAQGKEQDVVIVSLSRNRTGTEKRNAFFNDRRRINVLLSRAREKLILIAAEREVRHISTSWKFLFEIIWEQHGEEQKQMDNIDGMERNITIFDMPTNNNAVLIQYNRFLRVFRGL